MTQCVLMYTRIRKSILARKIRIQNGKTKMTREQELIKWLEEYRINLLSLMGQDDYVIGKLDVIKDVLKKLNQNKDEVER